MSNGSGAALLCWRPSVTVYRGVGDPSVTVVRGVGDGNAVVRVIERVEK